MREPSPIRRCSAAGHEKELREGSGGVCRRGARGRDQGQQPRDQGPGVEEQRAGGRMARDRAVHAEGQVRAGNACAEGCCSSTAHVPVNARAAGDQAARRGRGGRRWSRACSRRRPAARMTSGGLSRWRLRTIQNSTALNELDDLDTQWRASARTWSVTRRGAVARTGFCARQVVRERTAGVGAGGGRPAICTRMTGCSRPWSLCCDR